MKKINIKSVMTVLLALFSLSAHSQDQEIVITLEEAGTLKEALSEIEATKIKHLTLKGPIDANDIKVIRSLEGRLSALEVLDLKDVTELVPREKVYYYSYSVNAGDGLHSIPHCVCIGDRDTSIVVATGPFQSVVYDYNNDLAYAFIDMPFKRIVWPSCLKEIGGVAMHNCKSLEEFIAPTNPEYIGGNAFSDCSELRKIPTLKDVKKMRAQAFEGCSLLTALDEKHEIDLSSLDTIPEHAFYGCSRIQSIKFSPNVKVIRSWAFYNCSGIESVVIPNSINMLYDDAFYNCTSLVDVSIPSNVTNIQYNAFNNTPWYNNLGYVDGIKYINNVAMESARGTTNLKFREGTINIADNFGISSSVTNIVLPSTLQRIGCNAFASKNVTGVILPTSLKTIGEGAFRTSSLTSIDLPESLEEIGNRAFGGCSKLTKVSIPSSVKKIGQGAFSGCALETLTLPSTIEEIGDFAFSGNTSLLWINYNVPDAKGGWLFDDCSSLERVTLGEQVKIIPDYCFSGCANLLKATLSEGLEEIGDGAFIGCKSLKEILFPNTLKKIGESAFEGCLIESISLPASIEEISYLFAYTGNTTLKSVYYNIPNAKVNSEIGIFEGCKALENVTFGDQVRVIPSSTFRLCSALKDVILPEELEEIGRSAFGYCTSLTSVTIPKSVKAIGDNAFRDGNMTSVTINSNALVSKSYNDPERSGSYSGLKMIFGKKVQEYVLGQDVKSIGEMAFCYCGDALTSVIIPNGVTSIDNDAFAGSAQLSHLTIPESVTSIGERAFYYCKALTSITIPKNVETIGNAAFEECTSLASVNIENGVKSIGDNAFKRCFVLTSVVIPNSVTSLGKSAFSECRGLSSVTIGNKVGNIGVATFEYCENLTSVNIGNSVKIIDKYAFRGCKLTSVTIPNSVTNIRDYAFSYGSGGPASITIGEGITYIGIKAFDGMNSLTDVYCYSKAVPNIEFNAFAADTRRLESTTLHVPAPSIAAYKKAVAWKDFGKIVAIEGTIVPGDVTGTGSVNVQDATIVVNYILGTEINDAYDYSVADMNNDNEVDVFDVTAMISVILSSENAAKARRVAGSQPSAATELLYAGKSGNGLSLSIDQAERFTSFQMDVDVPDGVTLEDVQLTHPETEHILRYAKTGENSYRIMALSLKSTPLNTTAGGLLELSLSDGGSVLIDNIMFVTPKGDAFHFGSLSYDDATGIDQIAALNTESGIYDLSGRKMNMGRSQLPKGVYIINQKKVVIK